jgi:hypothetical protein
MCLNTSEKKYKGLRQQKRSRKGALNHDITATMKI